MVHRLLFLLLGLSILALAAWDIWRRNRHLWTADPGQPQKRPMSVVPPPDPEPGNVLAFKRDPYRVLGLKRTASPAEVDATRARLLDENAPEKLANMSEELRTMAQRRREEVEAAYAEITSEASQG